MTRIGGERDGDIAGGRRARSLRTEVVLDVAGAALVRRDHRVDRAFTLELAQDRVVAQPERVGQDVQPAAVGHPDHDLVRTRLGGELDRLVEHRHEHVEPFDRELFLPEERPAKVLLERLRA